MSMEVLYRYYTCIHTTVYMYWMYKSTFDTMKNCVKDHAHMSDSHAHKCKTSSTSCPVGNILVTKGMVLLALLSMQFPVIEIAHTRNTQIIEAVYYRVIHKYRNKGFRVALLGKLSEL